MVLHDVLGHHTNSYCKWINVVSVNISKTKPCSSFGGLIFKLWVDVLATTP